MIRIARRRDPFNNILTCHSYHQMMSAYVPLCRGCSRMHVALVHQWLSRTLQNAPSSSVSFSRSSEPLDLCAHDQIRSSILGMFPGELKKSFPWKGHLLMMACKESFFITVPLEWVFSSDVAIQARRLWTEPQKAVGNHWFASVRQKKRTVRHSKEKEGRCLNWEVERMDVWMKMEVSYLCLLMYERNEVKSFCCLTSNLHKKIMVSRGFNWTFFWCRR